MKRQFIGVGVGLFMAFTAAAKDPAAAAIASAHPLATQAGREIIDAGGNAFDAAIAVAAALAVVEPYSSGIGGGGFFLIHRSVSNSDHLIDARERAPLAATKDMYLDAQGEVIAGKSVNGALAAGIPGTPAALVHLALYYGRLPLDRSLAPAIKLAREGFAITAHYRTMAGFRKSVMASDPATAQIFLDKNEVPALGYRLKQSDLADTLQHLALEGTAGFYAGPVADQLIAGVTAGGGIWKLEDLTQYKVIEREPMHGVYHDMEIVSAPLPSSGGIVLLEALNILERYKLADESALNRYHLVIEAMRRAYRDRAEYLGDPDFTTAPIATLIDKAHATEISANISPDKATPSSSLKAVTPPKQGDHTTHFSILDAEGNRVAATLSINLPFGACFTPRGSGVLLNNEMDDFSSRPLTPNAFGLVGADANAIGPGKRPLSSMAPTFLVTKDRIGILGTPGGSRIISMVLLGALEFYAGTEPAVWVKVPRYHHQYLPDEVLYEPAAFDEATRVALAARGHALRLSDRDYGNMQAILWNRTTDIVTAASDPRGEGAAVVWAAKLPEIKDSAVLPTARTPEVAPLPKTLSNPPVPGPVLAH